jgi:hypothetical protein
VTAAPRSYLVRFAQLSALWAYSVSQPVLSYLGGNDEFLVLRDSTRVELIVFALLLAFGPPLAAVGYSAAASLVSPWVGDMLYLAAVVGFFVPFAFQLVKPLEPGRALALLSVVGLCALTVALYVRWRPARLFLTASIVLPLVSLVWFVRGIPISAEAASAADVRASSPRPVVIVVLDELPTSSVLTGGGDIDRARFPTFGRLARTATWYPNATTVHEITGYAVPAILTGRVARTASLATLASYPQNLFTALAPTHRLFVRESATRLCGGTGCSRTTGSLPQRVGQLLGDVRGPYVLKILPRSITDASRDTPARDRRSERAVNATEDEFEAFLRDLPSEQQRGSLHFVHLLVPHLPWRFLPSGLEYEAPPNDGKDLYGTWVDNPWLVRQALQRHLLQVQYVDRLLGRMVRRLERVGLYDRALVVVVADHGASFRPGISRRQLGPENFADIASVPLFVKYPGQKHGVVDRRAARTIDVLPTIADVLGLRLPWRVDGSSLRGPAPPRVNAVVLDDEGMTHTAPLRGLARQNAALVLRHAAVLGEGRDSLYRIGVHRALLGESIGEGREASASVRVSIQDESRLRHVDRSSGFVPALVEGVVEEGRIADDTELAIVVNGRVRALTRCFLDEDEQRFRALVPAAALRDGANRVDVYSIGAGGSRLVHLGGTGS